MNKEIPTIILEQLGGKRFVKMTGVKDFIAIDDYTLRMTLPRNQSKANRLEINLTPMDLYTVRFYKRTCGSFSTKTFKYTPAKEKDIKVFEDVYCDQLEELFRDVTGLETRMPRIIWINV